MPTGRRRTANRTVSPSPGPPATTAIRKPLAAGQCRWRAVARSRTRRRHRDLGCRRRWFPARCDGKPPRRRRGGDRSRHRLAPQRPAGERGCRLHRRPRPGKLLSECLRELRAQGRVSLTCALPPSVVDGMQQVCWVDACEGRAPVRKPPLAQPPAAARATVELVSLWLAREYMQTPDICLGHSPGIAASSRGDWPARSAGLAHRLPRLCGARATAFRRCPAAWCLKCGATSAFRAFARTTARRASSLPAMLPTRRH